MTIPKHFEIRRPLLDLLSDGQRWTRRDIRDAMADHFRLTEAERAERVKSGVLLFDNRVHWATVYMCQAQLTNRPQKGLVEITERGRHALEEFPDEISNENLERYEEFRAFRKRRGKPAKSAESSTEPGDGTPAEELATNIDEANAAVAGEAVQRVIDSDWSFLEHLVLRLLAAMGYGGPSGDARHLGKSGDGGVDGVLRQDPLGLNEVYVQAKRYAADRTVGRPEIQTFVGALHGQGAGQGVFITTSKFSRDAEEFVSTMKAVRIVLIDGAKLGELMVQYNVGVETAQVFELKRVDEDFFS